MYAKIINNTPRYASKPKWVNYNGKSIANPPDDILQELGYYVVQETDMPSDAPTEQHYESSLEYTDGTVKQVWTLVDDTVIPEPEPTPEERISILEEQQEITDAAVQDLIITMMGGE